MSLNNNRNPRNNNDAFIALSSLLLVFAIAIALAIHGGNLG